MSYTAYFDHCKSSSGGVPFKTQDGISCECWVCMWLSFSRGISVLNCRLSTHSSHNTSNENKIKHFRRTDNTIMLAHRNSKQYEDGKQEVENQRHNTKKTGNKKCQEIMPWPNITSNYRNKMWKGHLQPQTT